MHLEDRLIALAAASGATMRALRAARALNLPSWCIGAGFIRNLVWDDLHGYPQPTQAADVDLVFFDADNLSPDYELHLRQTLVRAEPAFNWEPVNQAAVHRWLEHSTGQSAQPFNSLEEGVASWPEVATCVGLTLKANDQLAVIAPRGLNDLFDMVVRWNPVRVSKQVYLNRLVSKQFTQRWPQVKVLPP